MKDWIANKPGIVGVIAVVIILFAGYMIFGSVKPSVRIDAWPNAYYYDLNSGKTFVLPAHNVPPVAAPSGPLPDGKPAGVWAAVFSCGSCADANSRFVGWLEKFDEPAHGQLTALIEPRKNGYTDFNPYETKNFWDNAAQKIAAPNATDQWIPMTETDSEEIQAAVAKKCAPATASRCQP